MPLTKKWMKIPAYVTFVLTMLILVYAFWRIWYNNSDQQAPSSTELKQSLDQGIRWLEQHRELILDDNNPMLWLMIKESAEITQNGILITLYKDYKKRYLDRNPNNVWLALFNPQAKINIDPTSLDTLPDYDWLLIYGSSCDIFLGREERVLQQQSVHFCSNQWLLPTCYTHQLMGITLMERNHCGDLKSTTAIKRAIQERVRNQLVWDFRLVDVYLQRVLMLVYTGSAQMVKPVWVHQILAAQAQDGGWRAVEPLLRYSTTRALGFTSKGIGVRELESNFHTTAQGVFLLSLLSDSTKQR